MQEIWLGTDDNKIRFPVTPQERGVSRSADISSENVISLGEVTFFNGMKLKTISLSSFFPAQEYSFCGYSGFMKPYEFSEQIQKWMYAGTVVRLIITETPTNLLCLISHFETKEQDFTGDLYFDLTLTEYKKVNVPKIETSQSSSTENTTRTETSESTTSTQKTHKVVKGDSLWDIAQKFYGKGSLYKKIKEANWDTYPELKTSNVIYTRMTLVIP
jgi:nucleoid-associated protein YgaU